MFQPEFKAYTSTKMQADFSKIFLCFWKGFAICDRFEYVGKGSINCYYKSTSHG